MIYTIYAPAGSPVRTGGLGEIDALRAIPEGLAKWALIFPPVWLTYHRLWWALATYCLLLALAMGLLVTPFGIISLFLGGLPGLYLMLEGYELCRRKVESESMELVGLVDASSDVAAIGHYLDRTEVSLIAKPDTVSGNRSAYSSQLTQTANSSAGVFGLFSPREI